jgi:acyl-CoA synthetase (AMP-forming)/AMP-acid ligase II
VIRSDTGGPVSQLGVTANFWVSGVFMPESGIGLITTPFGVPDPEFGEQVKAAVELQEGVPESEETATDLITWCRARLASFKCPKSIDFHDTLPREASDKLKKRYLRHVYWDDQPPKGSG